MHAQCADEVALHEPEGFGQQQRARHLGRDAIHHFAPELMRHGAIELLIGQTVFGARRNGPARARPGEPEPVEMPLRERHSGVKTNHGEHARHMQNGLDQMLAHRRIQIIELRRVIPRKAGAVIAVIDVAHLAGGAVAAAKDHGRIGLVIIVALNLNLDAAIGRKIRPVKGIIRIRRVPARQKPLRMFDHPGRINAHVIGHHVAGQPDAALRRAVAQLVISRLAAQVVGNAIVKERIGRGHCVSVAAKLLDSFAGAAALPQADQPERGEAAPGQRVEFFIRNLIEPLDRAAIPARELVEPNIRALGHKHSTGHPFDVRAEFFIFHVAHATEGGHF